MLQRDRRCGGGWWKHLCSCGTPSTIRDASVCGADCGRLVFEAPTKELQAFFVTRLGSDVNLANVAPDDVIALETLRLGLRSDTLVHFELERHQERKLRIGA